MSTLTKKKILESFKQLEKNFNEFSKNNDLKKTMTNIKKMKNKRVKQVDKMLSSNIADLKKSFTKEQIFLMQSISVF